MGFGRLLIAIATFFSMVSPALGETRLDVEAGWGGKVRPGHWTPVFITVSDTRPRQVRMEIYAPHDDWSAMRLSQRFPISPTPATYSVIVPLSYALHSTTVVIRDDKTGRKLAEKKLDDEQQFAGPQYFNEKAFIGVTGEQTSLRLLEKQITEGKLGVGYLTPSALPAAVAGYESLDILVLNKLNFLSLSIEQQQAIADWVRGGGHIVMWPGTDPIPRSGALVEILPAQVGDAQTIELDTSALDKAGLGTRFAKLPARKLLPLAGTERVELSAGPQAAGWRANIGFGTVTILPIDVGLLQFSEDSAALRFWGPILGVVINVADLEKEADNYGNWNNATITRKETGLLNIMNSIADIEGVGKFGFSYIAYTMLALIAMVGPIDWFVLKKLRLQPWTWITTAGWIALITVSAIYIGSIFKSGELHLRTFRLIDQADNHTLATTEVAAVYSPRTTMYQLNVPAGTWWQPAGIPRYYNSRETLTEVAFYQDQTGTRPAPMEINVWNLRFLKGDRIDNKPPVIEAHLKKNAGNSEISGTITNHGPTTLHNIRVQVGERAAKLGEVFIAPGKTINVSATLMPHSVEESNVHPYAHSYSSGHETLNYSARDIAVIRSLRIEKLMETGNFACVLAEGRGVTPTVTLAKEQPLEQHWEMVRALVRLEK